MSDDKIPYIVFEGASTRLERTIRRLWILCIILIILLVGSNGVWLYYENSFEDVENSIKQEAEWDSESEVIMNGTGTINYGESKANNNDKKTSTENRR